MLRSLRLSRLLVPHRWLAVLVSCCWLATACGGQDDDPDGASAGGASSGGASSGGTTSGGSSSGGAHSGGASTGGANSGGEASGGAPLTGGSGGADNTGGGASFVLTSPALDNVVGCSLESPSLCDVFPDENVSYMDNANISPELGWTNAPAGTQSFALVLMDVTYGQAHWALWNIPVDVMKLDADVPQDTANPASPPGSRQSNANFATTSEEGYFGPHVPCNVFEFELYALSTSAFSPQEPESAVLVSIELQELGETVLGVARLTARSGDYGTVCP